MANLQNIIEEWKDVEGYEGKYRVSTFGRVFTYGGERILRNRFGKEIIITWDDRQIAMKNSARYLRASLSKNGEAKHFSVHRLVALAFIPNPDGKPQVNHKNGKKKDNNVSNLEWATSSENITHAYATGLVDISKTGKHRIGVMPAHAKEVLDTETGIVYESIKAVEKAMGITPNMLRSFFNGRYNHTKRGIELNNRFKIIKEMAPIQNTN